MRLLTTLLLLALALPLLAADWQPPRFSAVYAVTMGGMTIGESRRSLTPDPAGGYTYESTTVSKGVAALFVKDTVIERSRFQVSSQLQPLTYTYERTGGKKERHVRLEFDWAKGMVVNRINADPWQMAVPTGTQDKLLYQLAVMRDLSLGKTRFEYKIADGGKLKVYEIARVAEETVDTPIGRLTAVKIQRVNDKRGTTLWCAKELGYLPVRIEQTETDGAQFTAVLKSVQGLPVARQAQGR